LSTNRRASDTRQLSNAIKVRRPAHQLTRKRRLKHGAPKSIGPFLRGPEGLGEPDCLRGHGFVREGQFSLT
jgi:hypothetical protein